MDFVTLNNGVGMPKLGFGTYQILKEETQQAVRDALDVGYRLIDTAQSYNNEEEVGNAIRESGIPREEIFITTKVWLENYGYEKCRESVLKSLEKLQTDYIDLVLLHQPFSDYYAAYHALEDLYKQGVIRAIGVSNFYPDRLSDIVAFNEITPQVNQIETHIYFQEVKMKNHPCILGINAGLGLSLSFFPFLYLKLKNRKMNHSQSSTLITGNFLIYNDSFVIMKNREKKRKYFYFLSVAILDFLQKFLTFFYVKLFLENFWIFDSFLVLVFSFLLLKTKVYAHHFLSLIMIIIIGIVFNVINYYDNDITLLQVVVTLLTEIFYCLENVICKLTFNVKFSSPYEICLFVGIFELLLCLLCY